jgi:hypothetical protein
MYCRIWCHNTRGDHWLWPMLASTSSITCQIVVLFSIVLDLCQYVVKYVGSCYIVNDLDYEW